MKRKLLIILLSGLILILLTGCLPGLFPEPNNPPVIASSPLETATVGEEYVYNVLATDPDGDDLTYSLTTNPSTDMTIEQNSGVISWTPTTIGNYEVTVEVSDGKLSDIQNFFITVSEPLNQAPVITPIPDATITEGETFTYPVEATDPEGDVMTYSLSTFPDGMTINPSTGVISWTPTTTGNFEVTVEVSDGELVATQSFSIVVGTDNQAPVITPIHDTTVTAGENFTYPVEATDPEGDVMTYSLSTFPDGMTINPTTGVINWTPTAVGNFEVTVVVSDGELSDTQSFTVEVIAPRRVVMWELFEGPACARCKAIHSDIVRLRQEYSLDELVILEEYGWDTSLYTGWGIKDVRDRYHSYIDYVGSDKSGFPAAFFNGINKFVYYGGAGYSNYKSAINAELAKPTKIAISASYSVTGKIVNISGNIFNISSGTLNNLVVEAMVYENSVYSEYRKYNVEHVVRDIITYEDSGDTITSFSPGDSYQFSLTSSSLSNVKDMSNIHVVVYVQAPNSPNMEILQALYVYVN